MRKLSRWIPVIGGAIAGGIIALVIASNNHSTKSVTTTVVTQTSASSEPTAFAKTGSTGMSINQIYKQDAPGVVDILVTSKATSSSGGLFGGGGTEVGEGAGVVYDDKGDILTDEHVVANATKVEVTFQDGTKVPAKVLGSSAGADIGVIKVNVPTSELHPIKFADSNTAIVGDPVVAIGSPFSLPETVTSGIVSQTGRVITAPNNFSIADAIQTDAAINPGNSGGPLLNAEGEVLGLNDQIETDNTNSATGEGSSSGIGFATPGNEDVKLAQEIIAGKPVQQAYLGVKLSGSTSGPAVVAQVTAGGPGQKGGLQVNDTVTKLNSTTITSSDALISDLARLSPGDKVTLTVKRQGQTKQLTVTLGNRPATAPGSTTSGG